jgi:hypothetical protein
VLRNTFFCVHIPKTGGTSFRKAFEVLVGSSNVYYDYSGDSIITSDVIKQLKYINEDPYSFNTSEIADKDLALICGHVNIVDYANLILPENIFTFIRNPVERVISHYQHSQRKRTYTGSLSNFCQQERFRNIQHKMLNGYPLGAIGFIGITEEFNKSLEQLQNKYNLTLPTLKLNKNTDKSINEQYIVDPETISLIKSMNQLDLILYRRAQVLFKERESHDSTYNFYGEIENISEKNVSGWCYQINESNSFLTVEIFVNNLLVGTSKAIKFRPIFKQINAPREGHIGFRHYFKKQITKMDTVTCKIQGTEQYLSFLK